ncbi:kinase-like domain-containing protein [Gongronella butleri]|nr:kinase-like domain-containing protein [Gongronella butleri]
MLYRPVDLLGKKKPLEISAPYGATHVNHIHYDHHSRQWRWGGIYPDAMDGGTNKGLYAFVRRLYAELQIPWTPQYTRKKDISVLVSMKEATARIKHHCIEKDITNDYYQWTRIGQGASGVVFHAHDTKGEAVAIKRIKLHDHPRHDLLLNEILVTQTPKAHPNLVQHLQSYRWGDCIWIVMEWMDGGNLTDLVTYRYLSESEIGTVCREMLHGLHHLHASGIVHRDIKSDNVLISRDGRIKLSDFGFCARLGWSKPQRRTMAGTPCWMAPEIASGEPYGCAVDIWSFGITVIEMIESKPPYFSHPERATAMLKLKQRPALQHPERLTKLFRQFLAGCFELEPCRRPTAAALLQHPFLENAGSIRSLLPLINSSIHPSLTR